MKDDLRDAFRHCYWSALLTMNFGADLARGLTDAHERSTPNTPAREHMDKHNNTVGRLIGEYHQRWYDVGFTFNHNGTADDCYRSALRGELEYLDGPACGGCDPPPPNSFARRRETSERAHRARRAAWA